LREINTFAEIELVLNQKLSIALENVTSRIYDKLSEFILDEVYSENEKSYTRSWGFLDAWEKTKPILVGGVLMTQVYYAWETMTSNPNEFQHGSNYGTNSDFREHLASAIENGTSGGLFGNGFWTNERPFWRTFTEYLNGNINILFREECAKVGIPIEIGILAMWT